MVRITQILNLPPETLNRTLLLGGPGIGKTEVTEQYARELARKEGRIFVDLDIVDNETARKLVDNCRDYFVYFRVAAPHIFPEDVSIPKPLTSGDVVDFLTPVRLMILSKCRGLFFIDEMTNVKRADQRVFFYSLVQEGKAGWSWRISPDVIIVLAGNPPSMSADAEPLPAPLLNRLTVLNVEPPTVDEWCTYMDNRYGSAWERAVCEFLREGPSFLFEVPKEPEGLEPYPTPRSWTRLALQLHIIGGNADEDTVAEIIYGNVGRSVGSKFLNFYMSKVPKDFFRKTARALEKVRS
ncbi:ATP-binding protein [Thermoproteus tenax]|uniref:ATP-binding protein n=1 Tax=Thermoproteus tenax TaxID=2271 RepID=UPI000A71808A|nr:AAA family ATPase [Thermoproteus tenax]